MLIAGARRGHHPVPRSDPELTAIAPAGCRRDAARSATAGCCAAARSGCIRTSFRSLAPAFARDRSLLPHTISAVGSVAGTERAVGPAGQDPADRSGRCARRYCGSRAVRARRWPRSRTASAHLPSRVRSLRVDPDARCRSWPSTASRSPMNARCAPSCTRGFPPLSRVTARTAVAVPHDDSAHHGQCWRRLPCACCSRAGSLCRRRRMATANVSMLVYATGQSDRLYRCARLRAAPLHAAAGIRRPTAARR